MDPQLIFEVLGLDDLADITLEDLKDKITHIQPEKLPRQQLLRILMGWLHEQIKKDIQQKGMLVDFVKLLLAGEELHLQPFKQSEVIAAYKEYQAEDGAEFSVQRRRYEMVESDMTALFEQIECGLDPIAYTSADAHIPGEISNGESKVPWILGGGKQKSGANEIPLGKRFTQELPSRKKVPGDNHHQDLIKINEENTKNGSTKVLKNAAHIEQTNNLAGGVVTTKEVSPTKAHNIVAPDISPKMAGNFSNPPQASYVCKRCKEPGHWIQFCPTNLDSRWDTRPTPDYRCCLCKKWGDHFVTLCPLNEREDSLTKQRQRYEARLQALPRTPTQDNNSSRRDRRRLTPPSRRRSRSPKDRSRRKRHDIYRPDDTGYNSSSPWATRERIPRESTRREEHPREYSSGSRHRRTRFGSSSGERTARQAGEMPSSEERPRLFIGSGMLKQGVSEGRLSYENDVSMGSDTSPVTPKESASPKQGIITTNESEDEVMADTPLPTQYLPMNATDELERAKAEADKFLDALAAEFLSDEAQSRSSKTGLASGESVPTTGAVGRPGDKMNTGAGENVRSDVGEDSLKSSGPLNARDHRPQFGPIVTALFENRDNPIIHNKANRKTASDMMDEIDERPSS
ncbi:hypothetical protein F5Y06DRAFT_308507 [Hypoxylon sp. FL0890]|nr:hypothetical protein F5Y06DRAFT_308507 [Hypoxylon sp. FL0890]